MRLFWTPVRMGMYIRMPQHKNWKRKYLQYFWHTSGLHYGKEASKRTFFSKKALSFWWFSGSFRTPVRMGICVRMQWLKNWKANKFTLHNENIKQEIGIQLSCILEVKLQKEHFLAKYQLFFNYWRVYFQTVLGLQNK